MRLINTSTHLIEKFDDPRNVPPYAILTHTWGDNELELKDLSGSDAVQRAQRAQDNAKIKGTCLLAQAQVPKLSHAWIDTICIDQSSSSDKSEAINAMYRYYRDAKICFAILSDVDGKGVQLIESNKPDTPQMAAVRDEITNARWFTRGWTLQELLAPIQLMFYDKNWVLLGSRDDLCNTIAGKTRIESQVLQDAQQLRACSIAKRMSWAADRETRRPEDLAYSLLGIFDVNMPMIYGEGERAFLRLQEEIIKISDDHSIFAWPLSADQGNCGLLARSPKAFKTCSDVDSVQFRSGSYPYSVTNRGISITTGLTPWSVDIYAATLNCYNLPNIRLLGPGTPPAQKRQMGLFLKREREDDKYIRVAYDGMDFMPSWALPVSGGGRSLSSGGYVADRGSVWETSQNLAVNVRRTTSNLSPPADLIQTTNGFQLGSGLLKLHDGKAWLWELEGAKYHWDADQQILKFEPAQTEYGAILNIKAQKRMIKLIKIGFDFDFNPICHLFRKQPSLLKEFDIPFMPFSHGQRFLETTAWSEIRTTSSGQSFAQPIYEKSGFWRLKGDRLSGLDVYLKHYGQTQGAPHAHVTFKRVSGSNDNVWRFDIKNLGKESLFSADHVKPV